MGLSTEMNWPAKGGGGGMEGWKGSEEGEVGFWRGGGEGEGDSRFVVRAAVRRVGGLRSRAWRVSVDVGEAKMRMLVSS